MCQEYFAWVPPPPPKEVLDDENEMELTSGTRAYRDCKKEWVRVLLCAFVSI